MAVASPVLLYQNGTAYDLEQVVSWWPAEDATFMLVSFVSQESDSRAVISFNAADFETALGAYYALITGTTVIRFLTTEGGDKLVTESLNYIIV